MQYSTWTWVVNVVTHHWVHTFRGSSWPGPARGRARGWRWSCRSIPATFSCERPPWLLRRARTRKRVRDRRGRRRPRSQRRNEPVTRRVLLGDLFTTVHDFFIPSTIRISAVNVSVRRLQVHRYEEHSWIYEYDARIYDQPPAAGGVEVWRMQS